MASPVIIVKHSATDRYRANIDKKRLNIRLFFLIAKEPE